MLYLNTRRLGLVIVTHLFILSLRFNEYNPIFGDIAKHNDYYGIILLILGVLSLVILWNVTGEVMEHKGKELSDGEKWALISPFPWRFVVRNWLFVVIGVIWSVGVWGTQQEIQTDNLTWVDLDDTTRFGVYLPDKWEAFWSSDSLVKQASVNPLIIYAPIADSGQDFRPNIVVRAYRSDSIVSTTEARNRWLQTILLKESHRTSLVDSGSVEVGGRMFSHFIINYAYHQVLVRSKAYYAVDSLNVLEFKCTSRLPQFKEYEPYFDSIVTSFVMSYRANQTDGATQSVRIETDENPDFKLNIPARWTTENLKRTDSGDGYVTTYPVVINGPVEDRGKGITPHIVVAIVRLDTMLTSSEARTKRLIKALRDDTVPYELVDSGSVDVDSLLFSHFTLDNKQADIHLRRKCYYVAVSGVIFGLVCNSSFAQFKEYESYFDSIATSLEVVDKQEQTTGELDFVWIKTDDSTRFLIDIPDGWRLKPSSDPGVNNLSNIPVKIFAPIAASKLGSIPYVVVWPYSPDSTISSSVSRTLRLKSKLNDGDVQYTLKDSGSFVGAGHMFSHFTVDYSYRGKQIRAKYIFCGLGQKLFEFICTSTVAQFEEYELYFDSIATSLRVEHITTP